MVPFPQLADLVAETLQVNNRPSHVRRDVLAADLHEAVTELAVKQNASKQRVGGHRWDARLPAGTQP